MQSLLGVIDSFALPGGVTVIERSKPLLINGRQEAPKVVLHAVTEVAFHPDAGDNRFALPEFSRGQETAKAYFKRNILPVTVDPNGSSPWWVDVGGRIYQAEGVSHWRLSEAYEVRLVRSTEWRDLATIRFGAVVAGSAGSAALAYAALITDGFRGYSSSRSFRFTLPAVAAGSSVVAMWPTSINQQTDAPAFVSQGLPVTPSIVGVFNDHTVAILPRIVPPAGGRFSYEVV